jgi:hypothetical protein
MGRLPSGQRCIVDSDEMSLSNTLEVLPVAQVQFRTLHYWENWLANRVVYGLRERLPGITVIYKLVLLLADQKTNSSRSWN